MAQQHNSGPSGTSGRGGPGGGRGNPDQSDRGGPQGGRGNPDQSDRGFSAAGMAEGASDLWDSAYEQGARYYGRGSRAVGAMDSTTVTGLLVAGAIGFGLAWLLLGQSSGTDDVARRMSEGSDRYGRDHGRGGRHS